MHAIEWMTAAEAAEYLKVERRTLLQWVRQGKTKAFQLSGAVRHVWRFHGTLRKTGIAPCWPVHLASEVETWPGIQSPEATEPDKFVVGAGRRRELQTASQLRGGEAKPFPAKASVSPKGE